MGIRSIIHIDEEKCDGCGLCISACHEGAIALIDGKAKLISETYCDGLGDCLGECPQGAITIEKREAADYDQAAVDAHLAKTAASQKRAPEAAGCACPGSRVQLFGQTEQPSVAKPQVAKSALRQWPVQLKLVPPTAPYLKGADLLVCADCVPFAVGDFHHRYLRNRVVLVGCPKLDDLQYYYEKLCQIFAENDLRSITVLKMEVPCCSGIAQAAETAQRQVAPAVPIQVHTIGVQGSISVGCEQDA